MKFDVRRNHYTIPLVNNCFYSLMTCTESGTLTLQIDCHEIIIIYSNYNYHCFVVYTVKCMWLVTSYDAQNKSSAALCKVSCILWFIHSWYCMCIILSAYKLPLEALCMNRTTIFIAMSTNHEFLLVAKMMMHYDDGHDVVQTECLLCTPLQKLNTLVNQSIQLSLQVQAAFCLVLCHNLSLTTRTFISCVAI